MKKISAILITILFAMQANAQGVSTIRVKNVQELLRALRSDTYITLASGTYNISEVSENPHRHIEWVNNYDGFEPLISGLNNCTIKGEKGAKIVLEPRYAWVMNFVSCNSLKFIDVIFGHTEAGYCMGGVLSFTKCTSISLEGCSLYGSGTVGTNISDCNNIAFENCDIYECTYGLAYIHTSNNISFEKTTFRETGQFDLIEIMGCKNVRFFDCAFTENYNDPFMPYFFTIDANIWNPESEIKSQNIVVESCLFKGNNVIKFANDENKLTLKGNKFVGNKFATPR